jgi:hypothetical protein
MLRRSIAPAQVLRVDQLATFTFCGFRGGTTLDGIFAKPRRTTSGRCSMPVKTVALLVSGLPDRSGAPAPRCSAQGVARVRLDVGHRDTHSAFTSRLWFSAMPGTSPCRSRKPASGCGHMFYGPRPLFSDNNVSRFSYAPPNISSTSSSTAETLTCS